MVKIKWIGTEGGKVASMFKIFRCYMLNRKTFAIIGSFLLGRKNWMTFLLNIKKNTRKFFRKSKKKLE